MKTRFWLLFSFVGLSLLISPFDQFMSGYGEKQNTISPDNQIRVEDDSFNRQSLQTGETLTLQGTLTSLILEGLGVILIVSFIIVYAIKKRRSK